MLQTSQPGRERRLGKMTRQRLGELQPRQGLVIDLWQAQPVLRR